MCIAENLEFLRHYIVVRLGLTGSICPCPSDHQDTRVLVPGSGNTRCEHPAHADDAAGFQQRERPGKAVRSAAKGTGCCSR